MEVKKIIFSKHTIRLMLLFALIALSMDQVFDRFIVMKEEISNESKLHRLIHNTSTNEIPVFGSSKARSAFIPDSLGADVYNYGMEKCGFDVINFLLSIELSKAKTSPIIIEYNHRSFISSPSHTINMATYVPNLDEERVQLFLKKNDRLETRFLIPGLRYFGLYFQYLRYYFKRNTGSQKIVSRGGNFSNLMLSDEVFQTLVDNRMDMIDTRMKLEHNSTHVEEEISAGGRHELRNLSQYLDFSADSTLVSDFTTMVSDHPERLFVLVYTPQHWSELTGISNLVEMQEFYKTLDGTYDNVKVIDLSQLKIPDSGFKNTAHLNIEGAKIFSAELSKNLGF
jgi:hypothetical protein